MVAGGGVVKGAAEHGFIVGLGHAIPGAVRKNDDPCFEPLRQDRFAELFHGYRERRVLGAEASLAGLMAQACRQALSEAGVSPEDVSALFGNASVSEFTAPNELYAVHGLVGLSERAGCYPIADEFTSFLSGLRLSSFAVARGVALVACGCRWTQNVSYTDPVALSIGDGAGAAVLAPRILPNARRRLRVVGHEVKVAPALYGTLRMTPHRGSRPATQQAPGELTAPAFHMSEESHRHFLSWGTREPGELGAELLRRHGVPSKQVTLMGHQASRLLLDAWADRIAPHAVSDTLEELGNMTLASLPVTLSVRLGEVQTPYLLLVGLGLGVHVQACLLEVR